MCGAASADAAKPQKWYSNGFDKPAVLSDEGDNLLLTVGGATEVIDIESTVTRSGTLMASSGIEDYPQQDVWIVAPTASSGPAPSAMRKLMALVVLLCGAAGADAAAADKWCSNALNVQTVLSWSADGETLFVGSERWEYVGPTERHQHELGHNLQK